MKYVSAYPLRESNDNLSQREERILDLITRNKENWIKEMKRILSTSSDKDAEKFMDHYSVISLINKKPNEMASILHNTIGHEETAKWISSHLEEFPDSFRNSLGLSSDMKTLGF